jgi:hypothetical protein
MPYFDPAADKPERMGKIVGDVLAAAIVIALIVIFTQSMMFR